MTVDRPHENEAQRADRNFAELLQELRVVQTGVQILFAFLLTLPFQVGFRQLDLGQRRAYVLAVLLAVGAVVCLIAPVAYHRALFRMRLKDQIVAFAARFAMVGIGLLGGAIVTSVGLVLDVVLGRVQALWLGGAVAAVVIVVWGALPLLARARAGAP